MVICYSSSSKPIEGAFFFFFFGLTTRHVGVLVPRPWMEPTPPAVEVRSLNFWTTREVPRGGFLTNSISTFNTLYSRITAYQPRFSPNSIQYDSEYWIARKPEPSVINGMQIKLDLKVSPTLLPWGELRIQWRGGCPFSVPCCSPFPVPPTWSVCVSQAPHATLPCLAAGTFAKTHI